MNPGDVELYFECDFKLQTIQYITIQIVGGLRDYDGFQNVNKQFAHVQNWGKPEIKFWDLVGNVKKTYSEVLPERSILRMQNMEHSAKKYIKQLFIYL